MRVNTQHLLQLHYRRFYYNFAQKLIYKSQWHRPFMYHVVAKNDPHYAVGA